MKELDQLALSPPWEWPADAAATLARVLSDRKAKEVARLRAAHLSAVCVTPDEGLAQALLAAFESPEEPLALRLLVAPVLGVLLAFAEMEGIGEELNLPGLDFGHDDFFGVETVNRIVRGLRRAYQDPDTPELLRQRALEAACRWEGDWQEGAIAAAWASDDEGWRLTAMACMSYRRGFDEAVLEALDDEDPEMRALALRAAGENELAEAWPHVQAVLDDPSAPQEPLAAALPAAAALQPTAAREHVERHLESDDEEIEGAAHEAMEILAMHDLHDEAGLADGPLADDDEDADDEDSSPLPDRRSMESVLSAFGGKPEDPDLAAAQDLMYEAFEEPDPERRLAMAQEALRISNQCADAWVLIAEEGAETVEERARCYAMGLRAGESALGPEYFEENAGHFWGLLETRPYMRARFGLARVLHEIDALDEALDHYRELLRLNPNDNQGVRLLHLDALLEAGHDEEAAELLSRFDDDVHAGLAFGAALLAYRAEGDSETARERLARAVELNPHVPSYLTGKRRIPKSLPEYMSFGDDTEAASVAIGQRRAWRDTHGALPWLMKQTGKKKRRRR